jgi:hypothetical protein
MRVLVALQSEEFGDIEIGRGSQTEAGPTMNPVAETPAWELDQANTQTA